MILAHAWCDIGNGLGTGNDQSPLMGTGQEVAGVDLGACIGLLGGNGDERRKILIRRAQAVTHP